jgi:hypothetical protein
MTRGLTRIMAPRSARLAEESAIEGRTAIAAIEADSVEGDIQVAHQRDAWTTQIARLEGIYNRNRAQELLLAQLRRNVRRVDDMMGRRIMRPDTVGPRRMAAFAPTGGGLLSGAAAFLSSRLWIVSVGAILTLTALLGVQNARLNHAKRDLREARNDLATVQQQRDDWKQRTQAYAQAVGDAREESRIAAEALEAERRRQARAARAERERQREIQNVIAGSGDPPAWRLRDYEPPVSE